MVTKGTQNMKETFKDVQDFNGLYQISNLGRVKSLRFNKEKILNQYKGTKGYFNVKLYKEKKQYTFEIHKLVALAFLNYTPQKGFVIDHKDENRENNNSDNLQIITHRDNISKGFKKNKNSSKYTGVYLEKARKKKRWRAMIRFDGKKKHLGNFETEVEAHKCYLINLKKYGQKTKTEA